MALSDLQSQREQILSEIQRRGGKDKAPGFVAKLNALESQIRDARSATPAPAAPQPQTPQMSPGLQAPKQNDQMHTGGTPNFNESTGQPTKPSPVQVLPTQKPGAKPAPTPANKVGTVGDNFEMGTTEERLRQQLERANSEIQRRGGTAPNNMARKSAIEAELAKFGKSQPQQPSPQTPQIGPPLQEPGAPTNGPRFDNGGVTPPGQGNPNQPQNPNNPQQPGGPQGPYNPGGGGGYGGQGGPSPYQGGYGSYNLPGMYSSGWGNIQPPSFNGYQYQQNQFPQMSQGMQGPQMSQGFQGPQMSQGMQGPQGMSMGMTPDQMTQGIYNQATGGTISQFDTAANRLRERLDSAGAAQLEQARNRNIGRGFGVSGAQDKDIYSINQGSQNAYAQGLNELSQNFESLRQQGLQTALGATNTAQGAETSRNQLQQLDQSQRRNLDNNLYQFISGQDLQNRQFMDQTLFNMIGNREGLSSQERISNNQLNSARELADADRAFRGSEGAADRSLQQSLAELGQQGNNWRSSLNELFNSIGGIGGGSGLGGIPGLGGGGNYGTTSPTPRIINAGVGGDMPIGPGSALPSAR